jgi:hypothetical protein
MARIDADSVDFALHLLSLVYKLFRLRDVTDLVFAAFDFIRGIFTREQIVATISTIHSSLVGKVRALYNSLLTSPTFEAESGVVGILRDMKSHLNVVMCSEVVTSIRDFILSLVSMKFFDKARASRITKFLGPAPPSSALQM